MHLLANHAATLANAFRHSACQGVRLRPLLRIGGDIRPGPSVADELSNVSGAWSFHIRARVVLFCLACSVREPSAGPRRVPGGACGGVFAGPRHAPGLERLWETGRHAGWPGETAPPPAPVLPQAAWSEGTRRSVHLLTHFANPSAFIGKYRAPKGGR